MKKCCICKEEKPQDQFHKRKDSPDGRQYLRKRCTAAKNKKWERENPDRSYETGTAYEAANAERISERRRNARQADKAAVFAYYGSACNCCGESTPQFLTVDHIDNGGAEHRKEVAAYRIYWWLVRNGFPGGYQILCWNCNLGKEINGGVCPHQGGPGPLKRRAGRPRKRKSEEAQCEYS